MKKVLEVKITQKEEFESMLGSSVQYWQDHEIQELYWFLCNLGILFKNYSYEIREEKVWIYFSDFQNQWNGTSGSSCR